MVASSKPRMQRKFRYNAPLHMRQHFVRSHVDKELKKRLGIKARAIRVSEGDTVKVMSGSRRGATGKVAEVSLTRGRITISGINRKNAKGKELFISISPSNVYITDLNLSDKMRAERLKLSQSKTSVQNIDRPVQAAKPTQSADRVPKSAE